ncbi:MAG: hypothetical protein H0V07_00615, partial [Propionibacteriales bacterium]|nr:hypothetical protein [Propionibacteriales bacterium]
MKAELRAGGADPFEGVTGQRAKGRLHELEVVIERGLTTFVEVGEALATIRGSKLYRFTHTTFEAYCKERWGFTSGRARQLMDSAEIATTVAVANDAQARELAPLKDDTEALLNAWDEVQKRTNGHPTAAVVKEVVREREVKTQRQIAEDLGIARSTVSKHIKEGTLPNAEPWFAFLRVMDALEELTERYPVPEIIAAIPERRQAGTTKRLRRLGSYLGRIAWTLEGTEAT